MSQTNESSKSPDESTQETENIVSSEAASTTEYSSTDSRAEYLKEVVDMRLELKEQRLEMVTQLRERVNLVSSIFISLL